MLNALTIEDSSGLRVLTRLLRPVDPDLLPFLPAVERRLAIKNASDRSFLTRDPERWDLVSLLSGALLYRDE